MTRDNHSLLENGSEIFWAAGWTMGSALRRVANIAFSSVEFFVQGAGRRRISARRPADFDSTGRISADFAY
jgi:hypothetical protein